jgi:hypothetical protein
MSENDKVLSDEEIEMRVNSAVRRALNQGCSVLM